mmetsp:Transcript_1383/g.1830  ORF Transcript_1383/g.1830 Transcript_1383/m.1830 type:complete len:288 (-) Transcript_1383:36-899(-)
MKYLYVFAVLCLAHFTVAWWTPSPGLTWQWQLSGTIDTNIDYNAAMFDIDLFEAPQDVIDELHAAGKIVICYFSAGSYEDFRPDSGDFPTSVIGNDLDGWPGEKWLDIRQWSLLAPIMQNRLDLAVSKKCDGVEPDNMDGYNNPPTGFPLTYSDQITYNVHIANEAHSRNLSVGLKNDLDQIDDLLSYFDWALNEQCFQYDECDVYYDSFIASNKAVFGVEYEGHTADFCPPANSHQLSWLKKKLELDSWVIPCSNYTYYDDSEAAGLVPSISVGFALFAMLFFMLY